MLPRLFHIKYDSGLKEELLYLSDPLERESHTGIRTTAAGSAPETSGTYPLQQAQCCANAAGDWVLSSPLAVEESVFETLRIKRYGQLCVLLTPDMKIISYEFNMLGYDYSVPQPVILNHLGAMMQELQRQQHAMSQAAPGKLQKPHEVLDLTLNAIANLGHGLEGEVRVQDCFHPCLKP